LHCSGWSISGTLLSSRWVCPVCRAEELLSRMEAAMAVRAKVTCRGVTGNEVSFHTVYEPDSEKDSENARFTQATPWGEIKLGIDNPAALSQFVAGKEYYVDFTPATSGG
jgi:hypothetical protein